ncbi:hypothetical protein ACFQ2Y_32780 [Streptomyces malaysiensis subsp. malaysiensis]
MVITGGALALVLWNHPTPASVGLVLGIVVGILALLGILAGASGPTANGPAADGPAGSGPAADGPAAGGRHGSP